MSTAGLSCPFCGSGDVERVGAWGGQMITSQMRCRSCNTYFEAIREEFAEPGVPSGESAIDDRLRRRPDRGADG